MPDVYLDIETRDGFQHPHIADLPKEQQVQHIRFGIAVTSYEGNFMQWAWDSETASPLHLHYFLSEGDVMGVPVSIDKVVGWNINHFDLPVLMSAIDLPGTEPTFNTLDLFHEIKELTGRWYKLGVVLHTTLGITKAEPGSLVCDLLNSGTAEDRKTVIDYCRQDVEGVIALHNHLKEGKAIILPERPERKFERGRGDYAFYMDPTPRFTIV